MATDFSEALCGCFLQDDPCTLSKVGKDEIQQNLKLSKVLKRKYSTL